MIEIKVGQVWMNKSIEGLLKITKIIDDQTIEYQNISSGGFGKPKDGKPLTMPKSTLAKPDIFSLVSYQP